jgi:LmbE family N-acetylglucosaminyl deacetylase
MNTIQADLAYHAVAFGAHPDDVEMGMAGTVAGLTAAGKRVAIVSLTHGELGTHGTPETRAREAEAAARILGAHARHYDTPDGGVMDDLAARHAVARMIRQMRPTIVFAPYPHARSGPLDGKSNVDHLATGLLVQAGCKLARFKNLMPELAPHAVRRIYYYMLPEHVRAPSAPMPARCRSSAARARPWTS